MRSLRRSITSSSSTPSPPAKSSSSLSSSSTNSSLSSSSSSSSSSWIHLRSVLLVVASPSLSASSSGSPNPSKQGNLKSPWSRRRRKHALLPKQWRSLFGPDGKLSDGGIKFLKKVRSGGVDPSIRGEVWPLLLGVYGMNSSKDERDIVRCQNSQEYEDLRKECERLLKLKEKALEPEDDSGGNNIEGSTDFSPVLYTIAEEDESSRISCSSEKAALSSNYLDAQKVDQVPESSSLILAEGNEEKSKVPVLQCSDRIPAAAMESHIDPELNPSVKITGGNSQKSRDLECQKEDTAVECQADKPQPHVFQALVAITVVNSHENGHQGCQKNGMTMEGHAEKCEHEATPPSVTACGDHLQKNGKQDYQREDAVADGLAKKPEHKVLRHSAPISREILPKNGDMDCQEKDTPVEEDKVKSGVTSEGGIADDLILLIQIARTSLKMHSHLT
ncbi:hypothetical protein MLD38_010183 [Melastoma candidum]|uniref:Uncharacterized protein n=1 Tax=Melastoma candidum TaxID=119954 RepID=A0ACB9R244_9MYRT|nr:hypothetical protein MLD38_010183 [Melastoma candidum]